MKTIDASRPATASETGDVTVSICCLTHNHGAFIERALEGFLSQRTSFRYEVIVHDDASVDGASEVVRRWTERYPSLVRSIVQPENQWSRGVNPFAAFIWPRIRGRYVALCDGDDYWTDPFKLAKQVDYLERHPSCFGCFHPVRVVHDDDSQPEFVWPNAAAIPELFDGQTLTLDDLLTTNVIHAPSMVYRWRYHEDRYPGDLSKLLMPFDWFLHIQHAARGPIGMIPDVMAVYRKHAGGAWWEATHDVTKLYRRFGIEYFRFFRECSRSLGRTVSEPRLSQTLSAIIRAYLVAGDGDSLKQIAELSPDDFSRGVARLLAAAE
ncbi:MAG TPA: glycosyltransferase [Vicinamibacterales bacterium]